MIKLKIILIVLTLNNLSAKYSFAQGCSDAGFCTMNGFKPHLNDSTDNLNKQLKLGAYFGKADNAISVYGTYIEYNLQFSSKFGFDAKLTTLIQNGNGLFVYGVSDFFFNSSYKYNEKLKFTVGTKIPLTNANKRYENLPLPMDYQASLGTIDLILGIGYELMNFQLVAALQQPLTQNGNQFISSAYPLNSKLRPFNTTNKFQRSGDVLLRVSYPFNLNSKMKLTPSFLPIYHLANDKFTNEYNVIDEIQSSQGLTLNSNIYLDCEINSKNILQFIVGFPFMVRKVRPDGLTRSLLLNLEYKFKF